MKFSLMRRPRANQCAGRSKGFFSFLLVSLFIWAFPVAVAESPVFTATVVLHEGWRPTTFQVYATDEQIPYYTDALIYRIEYTLSNGETPSITLRFPCLNGENTLVPMLRFVDMNGDGYLDIEACRAVGASNTYATYFISGGENEQFWLAKSLGCLSNYTLYPKQGLILNYEQDGVSTGTYTLLRWINRQCDPQIYRVATIVDAEGTAGMLRERIVEYDDEGRETVLLDQTHPDYEQYEDWQPWVEQRNAYLWQGFDPTEEPAAR